MKGRYAVFQYAKLWEILYEKRITKVDFARNIGISTRTLAKLSKNEYVSMETLDKICNEFQCDIGDICEHVSESEV